MNKTTLKQYFSHYGGDKNSFMRMLQSKAYHSACENKTLNLYGKLFSAKDINKIIILADDIL